MIFSINVNAKRVLRVSGRCQQNNTIFKEHKVGHKIIVWNWNIYILEMADQCAQNGDGTVQMKPGNDR